MLRTDGRPRGRRSSRRNALRRGAGQLRRVSCHRSGTAREMRQPLCATAGAPVSVEAESRGGAMNGYDACYLRSRPRSR